MTEGWVVPELQTKFPDNFSVMLINYIYAQWPYTSLTGLEEGLNKPSTATGQSNYIQFRPGFKREFDRIQVLTRQGRTVTVDHQQAGWKREVRTTQVWVTTIAEVIGLDDTGSILRKLDEAIDEICGMYIPQNIPGIKDLIYEGNDRVYGPKDNFDKSDWETQHSVLMFYEMVHAEI